MVFLQMEQQRIRMKSCFICIGYLISLHSVLELKWIYDFCHFSRIFNAVFMCAKCLNWLMLKAAKMYFSSSKFMACQQQAKNFSYKFKSFKRIIIAKQVCHMWIFITVCRWEFSSATILASLDFYYCPWTTTKKEKRLEKHLIMIYLLCFKMMCHLVVVNITAVWGLKEPLAYLHVKAAAVFLTMEYFCS